jgi:histidyl-tRNA synthetase
MSKNRLSVEPYKGVRDFYPEEWAFLNFIFATCRGVAQRFGYAEYGASILEPAELYKAKGTENEEIVNEQTYTFVDRGDREVTLRPEMTPTVARMVAAKRRELGFPLRLFSIPNLFRYERPQRGRLREHWQLNVDLFGSHSPAADAEIIAVAHALMLAFGAKENDFEIRLGSRAFTDELARSHNLSDDQKKKFVALLDKRGKISTDEFMAAITALGIPTAALESEAPKDARDVLDLLAARGITNARFDASIVRGFDYYTGVVFEVYDTHPENNRALFGGGRYDNLTALFDDEPIVGVGFGMGDVTIRDFLAVRNLLPPYIPTTKVYVAVTGADIVSRVQPLVDELRAASIPVAVDFGEKKLADQIKSANKHQIPYLLVVGEDELSSDSYTVRDMKTGEEKKLSRAELITFLTPTL